MSTTTPMLNRIWKRIRAERQGTKLVVQMAQFWAAYVESEESINSSEVLQAFANFPEGLRRKFRQRATQGVAEILHDSDLGYTVRTRLLIAAEATIMAKLIKTSFHPSRHVIYKFLNQSWVGKVFYSNQEWSDESIDVYWIIGHIDLIYFVTLLSHLEKTIFLSHETIPIPETTRTLQTVQSIIEKMFKSIAEGDKVIMSHLELMSLEVTFGRSGELESAE